MSFFKEGEDDGARAFRNPETGGLRIFRKLEMSYLHLSGDLTANNGHLNFAPDFCNARGQAASNVFPNSRIDREIFKARNELFPFVIDSIDFKIERKQSTYKIYFFYLEIARVEFYEVIDGLVFSEASGSLVNTTEGLMKWVSQVEDRDKNIFGAHHFFCDPDSTQNSCERIVGGRIQKCLNNQIMRASGLPASEWLDKVADGELET